MKKRLTEQELIDHIRKRCPERGDMQALCGELGISQGYLSDLLAGKARAGAIIAEKLGFRTEMMFVPKAGRRKARAR